MALRKNLLEAEVKNRDIEAGAKAIAGDQMLPGGRRKKLARLVGDHLTWFDAAEARGMTWEDMIAALSAAGVTRPDGRPLSVGTLSSAVWRKREQSDIDRPSGPQMRLAGQTKPLHRHPNSVAALPKKKPRTRGRAGAGQSLGSDRPRDQASSQGASAMAFIQRAVRMRRPNGD